MENLYSELIIVATLSIVEFIKNSGVLKGKKLFDKIKLDNYRLVSLVIATSLLIFVDNISISQESLFMIENLFLIVLPSLGYDYIYNPIIKPILDLFRKKDKDEE